MARFRKPRLLAVLLPPALIALGVALFFYFTPALDADGWGSANRELNNLRQEIYLYASDHHHLPGTTLPEIIETLDASRPPGAAPTYYNHIRANQDRWGNPFILTITPTDLTIRSAGPDRTLNTADDLHTSIDDLPDLVSP